MSDEEVEFHATRKHELSARDVSSGRRQDNRAHERPGRGKTGCRFFQDDEDEFELEVRH